MARLARWFAFAGSLAGGLYLFLILAIAIHEILGHGLAAILCGGKFTQFSIKPSFTGHAWHEGVDPSRRWIVTAAGNLANLAVGLPALALGRRRWAFVAWLLMATNLGLALGYTFQGLVFEKGDAGELARGLAGPARLLVGGIAATLLLAFAAFALRRLVLHLAAHFQPSDVRGLRGQFLLAVVFPVTVMLAVKPSGEIFAPRERLLSAGAGLVALLLLGTWLTRRAPAAEPLRLPAWLAPAMLLGAAAAWAATALWLTGPVRV